MGSEFVGRNSSKSANKSNTTASLFNERPFFTPNREDNIENKQKFFKGVSSPDYFFSVGVNSPTPAVQCQDDNQSREQKAIRFLVDNTEGLTLQQHNQLLLTLFFTNQIRAGAMQPPRWAFMENSCTKLQIEIINVLRQNLTTLAQMTLAPATTQVENLISLIQGASRQLETVYGLVAAHLDSATTELDDLIKPVTIQGVTVSDRETFEEKLKAARESPDKRIPNTLIIVKNEELFRYQYQPLRNSEKTRILMIKNSIDKISDQARFNSYPDLKAIKHDTSGRLSNLDYFAQNTRMSKLARKSVEIAKSDLDKAILTIIGKLSPIKNVLSSVRTQIFEIEVTISNTLSLPQHDPSKAPKTDKGILKQPNEELFWWK
ncbi:hypothetical protein [Mastigocoleus sp. MO_188.B34]|uniref:hypothetical protein n=1 Tax=Mastigocoleus sp. MO_188.B34 TaxID=3036635 RepID=UPI00261728EB|nr:hypothetical protein [Mastigocoleus sp. MO_188.B34]MDJ0697436.1 hypothetical protein [Mastigocoleus sp. MO_188.B34]